jgi:hypothetical protein
MKGRGPRGLGRHPRTRCRGDKSQTKDTVPSGTSLLTTTGGTMALHHDVGRRSHRRLIMALLALAVGATLAVAASPALASSAAARYRAAPKITLKLSSAAPRRNVIMKMFGSVSPVEIVGESVILLVQKKSSGGKWTPISTPGGGPQVQYTPPESWMGIFNTTTTAEGKITGILSAWEGSVVYGSPVTAQIGHFVDYTMTSAQGTLWQDYVFEGGRTYTFSGTPVEDVGTLRWYFADADLGYEVIPGESYEGDSSHEAVGVTTEVEDGKTWVTNDWHVTVADELRTGDLPRPLFHGGHMAETRVVHNDSDPTNYTWTTVSTWDLAPHDSDAVIPLAARQGSYDWQYTPTKKGAYRVRAMILKTANHVALNSPWRTFMVR